MDTLESGNCPQCGHKNDRRWVLCDSCGARLPWAPPEQAKLNMSEMTDEQLAGLYGPTPKRQPFFLLTMAGRPALGAIVVLLGVIWWLLT